MKDNLLTTEVTKAGLKIYYRYDENSPKQHIKTVKCKYEPIIINLEWIRDYKRILPTKEERMYLEMKQEIYDIEWDNPAQREYVNWLDVVCVKEVTTRTETYYTILMSDNKTEVRCSVRLKTHAGKLGIVVQRIKRLA